MNAFRTTTTLALGILAAGTALGATELISARNPNVTPVTGNSASSGPSSTLDGRLVAFSSDASDFVTGDTNQRSDVFVYDRTSGTMERVSLSSAGEQANSDSYSPAISSDGRYVTFVSLASNLVPNDTNNALDVFVYDRQTDATTRVSVSSSGAQTVGGSQPPDSTVPSISANGRYIAFLSTATNLVSGLPDASSRVFVRDTQLNTTTVVSVSSSGALANQSSSGPVISADGNSVAFASAATNLAAGDTNNVPDVFVRNRSAGTTTRVSVSGNGAEGNAASDWPALSADGRYVTFRSSASNLAAGPAMPDSNIFVRDSQASTTALVSTSAVGKNVSGAVDPSISADGSTIAYTAVTDDDYPATWQIFVANRTTGAVRQVTFGPSTASFDFSGSVGSWVSTNGRYVFFSSSAYNFVDGDGNRADDVFAFDSQTSTFSLVSASKFLSRTAQGESYTTGGSALSQQGRYAAFTSAAATLTPGDRNGWPDVFVADRSTGQVEIGSVNSSGEQGNDYSRYASISNDGNVISFTSWSNNLAPNDTSGYQDIFAHDQATGITMLQSADSNGNAGWEESYLSVISGNGRYVAFNSNSSNLAPGGGLGSLFLKDRTTGATTLISKSSSGEPANSYSLDPSMSDDGRFIVFESDASNLTPGDSYGTSDVFVHDRTTGQTKPFALGLALSRPMARAGRPSSAVTGNTSRSNLTRRISSRVDRAAACSSAIARRE
jgi:hypothetical protein